MLNPAERLELLAIARAAIERTLGLDARAVESTLTRSGGAFVTVKTGGELRGCIGWLETDRLLSEVVAHCAVAASTQDPRFPPLREHELALLRIEISVLGPTEPVDDIAAIQVGTHGLIVEQGLRRGLLLPQVPTEHGWDRDTFVRYTCLKAGLPEDAWKRGAALYRFEADVFGDAM